MKHILTVTFSALMLAGCADGYDKSSSANGCKPLGHPPSYLFYNFGSGGLLDGVPSRDLFAEKKPHDGDGSANKCVHGDGNEGREPHTTDLQKIGAARSFGIQSRSV